MLDTDHRNRMRYANILDLKEKNGMGKDQGGDYHLQGEAVTKQRRRPRARHQSYSGLYHMM